MPTEFLDNPAFFEARAQRLDESLGDNAAAEALARGRQVLVLRTVTQPTRMLHPATDCYRGLGYRIHSEQLEVRADQQRWRCFVAQRAHKAVRVCERIEDAQGQGYTDTSAWYWASLAGQSHGPWQAVTVATPIPFHSL